MGSLLALTATTTAAATAATAAIPWQGSKLDQRSAIDATEAEAAGQLIPESV